MYTAGLTFNFNKQLKLDLKWITTPYSWQLTFSVYTGNVDSLLSKFNLYNKTHIHVDISGDQWCRDWQSRVHILCFIQLKWSDTSCSPPNFFCLSVITTAMNKAPHQYNLPFCHSNTWKKDFMSLSRWSWGGIPPSPLISLSNPSFYVGSLLCPWRGNHILIRSVLS